MWILNLYSYISSEMRRFRQKKVLNVSRQEDAWLNYLHITYFCRNLCMDFAFSKEKAGFCTNRGEDCAFSEEKAESCTNRSQDFAL